MSHPTTRTESDPFGPITVPAEALYGASTARAHRALTMSQLRFSPGFIRALGTIKLAAVRTNRELGLIESHRADPIERAANELRQGEHLANFILDIFQTGSGTGTHMNANEVIAARARELLGGSSSDRELIHPNDHVNLGQSSNDVMPSALHIAASEAIEHQLLPALHQLRGALSSAAARGGSNVKLGRTHLQDAVPMTFGQELGGYAEQIAKGIERVERSRATLYELPLGGTAIGTGFGADRAFGERAITTIAHLTGLPFRPPRNRFEAQGARDGALELSGQLKTIAASLMKIAKDIRWLATPRGGRAEITLPAIHPGSSLMPGKSNPVVPEAVMLAAAHIIAADTAVTIGVQHGDLELNTMLPLIAYHLLQMIETLAGAAQVFAERCIEGLSCDPDTGRRDAGLSLALATALNQRIGYDRASRIAHRAAAEHRTVLEVALEEGIAEQNELRRLLDPEAMTGE